MLVGGLARKPSGPAHVWWKLCALTQQESTLFFSPLFSSLPLPCTFSHTPPPCFHLLYKDTTLFSLLSSFAPLNISLSFCEFACTTPLTSHRLTAAFFSSFFLLICSLVFIYQHLLSICVCVCVLFAGCMPYFHSPSQQIRWGRWTLTILSRPHDPSAGDLIGWMPREAGCNRMGLQMLADTITHKLMSNTQRGRTVFSLVAVM